MNDKEKAEQIMGKFNRDPGTFTKNATREELKTLLKFVADEPNRKQRKLFVLE